ncbi:basement membrane-specific heparan sulfate proteoglycan core protein isoform X1 [Perognathus longimembris pacificus]|uniref:basement membrane-specific heparan sulfate proteoglycan core protein isoform X1 n=1 Tax=Perognathus longimembris pacificus TaxID=214514 RepID=UPI0020188E64|nr:basement membrane-specific heparan sulfate proteoglycan core protein isoform X1 [Perognathus longimembris pacificus]
MGWRAAGTLLLALLLHGRLLAVTLGLRAYDGLSLPEDTETITAGRAGWSYSYLSDDEDLLADDASGDGLGSGDLGSGDFQMVYFRALVNFTHSIEYSPQLEDAGSKEFREVSDAVVDKLESEYLKIPGDQVVSVVFIKELDGWVFVELDVGSEGNADGAQIQEVLHTVVSQGSIGSYITSPRGFQFRRLGTAQTPPTPPASVGVAVTSVPQVPRVCTETEFACRSHNECVALEYRCDRRPDCRDMSDELDCEDAVPELSSLPPSGVEVTPPPVWLDAITTPPPPVLPGPQPLLPDSDGPRPCGPQEATCHSGHCIPKDYLCDGQEDCRDGSDELDCGPPQPCEPNEFACGNGHCALKLWRCDGDFDCEDRTDEANCTTKQPEEQCGPTQFRCVSTNQCIPASFHCDEESDCLDRSDEFGCMPPQVVTPPQESIQVSRGQTVTFTCVAIGVPTPIINWRLNWGHIPSNSRVTVTSEGGRGTLTIRDVKESDQGAYTCEAMNARGMVFGIPDGVLELVPQRGPCPDGHFYLEDSASCLPCFCFGVTSVCQSSRRFRDQIHLRFDRPEDFKGVNVTTSTQPGMPPLSSTQLQIDTVLQEFQLVDLSRRFLVHDSFWALPQQFLGNKVDSYGGLLRYKVRYELARGPLEPVQKPDVVLVGAGYRLLSRGHTPTQPGTLNQRHVQLSEEHWVHESGRPVQRAEMLQVLASLEGVFIQTVYNAKMASVGLSDITMDTTTTHTTSHGRAHSVEECRCPIGYSGLSCESCDTHFTRVPGGPYLGTCSGCNCNGHASACDPVYGHCLNCQHNTEGPQCNKCKAGFFGDATKATATACRPCPCPYIDASRRFSDTCFLDTDGQATCDACAPGYTGRRCESCAPGYEGNPIQPDGKCRPSNQEIARCDERGSTGTAGDACRCKNNVVGRLCNECAAGSFHLSSQNPDGCLKCFCMGVSRQCTSSSWSRSQVLGASEEPGQFSLTNAAGSHTTSEGISSPASGELVFSSFHSLLSEPYFWSLPSRFRGDKVTSYGGELHFTVTQRPRPSSAPLHGQPLVVLQGNGIVLEHHTSQDPIPGQPSAFTVPFQEQAWQRPDGQPATREHLLMALAGIDALLIQASYTQQPAESRVSDISMDVAVPEYTGQDLALEVEQCTCPPGYCGPSCQDCDTGYTRMPSGLYLGTCERCSCHGHSEVCEPETGDCQGCQHHTQGPRCDQCQQGYYGDAQRGTPHDCQPCPCHGPPSAGQASHTCFLDTDSHPTCDSCAPGHSGRHCERCAPGYYGNPSQGQPCRRDGQRPEVTGCDCNPEGSISSQCDATGQCQCKAQVEGLTCSHCRPHHFYLSASHPDGCLPCFCMGVTQQCTSSSYTRHLIATHFAPGDFQGFALVNPQRNSRLTGGFTVEPLPDGAQLSFGNFANLGHGSFYWQLPELYQGDKVAAYGGKLRYTLSYAAGPQGSPLSDPDIQITGNNIMLVASQPAPLGPERRSYEIIFREEFWHRPDGQPATREHLLMALADLDELLVRATFSSVPRTATISAVSLEVARPGPSHGPRALEVEECRCPPGYIGLSCQDCAAGYTRTGSGLYLGHCELCECNGHSDLCHPETGACSQCQHSTAGEFCELCAPGYYGDATAGTPEDCQPCACPLTNPENMFSRTCESLGAGGYRCTACEPGYTGQYCEQCAPGYVGNPSVQGGRCLLEADEAPLVVQVHPTRSVVPQGGPHSLQCKVTGSPPHYFYWSREDGRPLPSSAQQRHQGSELHFPSVQPSDAGVYICTCRNLHYTSNSRAELLVSEAPSKPITVTVEEPRSQSVRPGADVTFVCTAKSKSPAYTLVWTRLHNEKLPSRAMDFNGILTIRNVQPSDVGTYTCTGSNMFAMDLGTATLHVQASGTLSAPVVSINPPQLTVQPGQLAEFRCSATGNPPPTLEWSGGPGGRLPQKAQIHGGILRLPAVEPSDQSQYLCRAHSSAGQHVARALLQVQGGSGPRVQVSPERTQVVEGRTVRLYCRAAGVPSASITWRKEGGSLPPQARSEHTDIATLLIPAVTLADAGFYLCVATGPTGTAQARIQVVVLPASGASISPLRIVSSSPSVTEGQALDLNCAVTGVAHTQITWYKRGGSLPPHAQVHGSRLRLPQVSPADSGDYVCRVESELGPKEASIVISVLSTPSGPSHTIATGSTQPIHIESSSSHVAEGQTLDLNCKVPEQAQVTWRKRGGSLPARHQTHGSLLRLHQVSPADSGEYVCHVTLGSENMETSVLVTIEPAGSLPAPGPVPPVRIESSSSTVAEGQTVDLSCVVAGQAHAQVTWYKRGGSLPARHQVRGSRLYIFHASPVDAGEYVCRANNGQEASITVTVTGTQGANFAYPPGSTQPIRIEPSSSHVAEGQTLDLNCVVPGQAHAQVTWQKRGGSLPTRHQTHGSLLRLYQVSPADSGEYVCRVEGGSTPLETSVLVNIVPAPDSVPALGVTPPVRIESSSSHLAEGQTLDLNCLVNGQAHAQITWHKRGGSLPTRHQVHGSRLRLPQVTPADSGEYVCRVASGSSIQEASVLVTIQQRLSPSHSQSVVYPVRIESSSASLANGHTLDLNCLVASHAPHTITWYKRGGSLPSRHQIVGSRLRIPQVTPADSGEYVCHVSNGAGSQETSLIVTIQGSGSLHVPSVSPPIRIESSSSTVLEGDTLDLNCVVAGQTQATITWFKRGGSLPSRHQAHGSRLRLNQMSVADSGEYVCRANNNIEAQETSIVVTVSPRTHNPSASGAAVPIRIESSSSHVAEGQTLDLNCVVPGHAHAQVTWHKRGGSLPVHHQAHGSRLRLYQVSPADSGEYTCRVLGSSGPLEASVLVTIEASGSSMVHVPASGGAPPIRIETSSSRVAEGQTLDLNCVVPGQAHAQVTWHRRGGSLPARHQVHGSLLRLNHVSPADSGQYSCRVMGSSGTLEASVLVTIEASSPSPIPAPGLARPIYIEPSSSHLAEGQTLDLNCVVPGQAHAQVTWHKRGGSLPARHQVHGSQLRLPHLSPADSGEYVCRVAVSSGPEQEASFTVTVPPSAGSSYRLRSPVISIDPPSSTVHQGQDASFKCLIHEGATPINLEWKTRNSELEDNVHISPNGSIITIVGTRPSNHGAYRCVASNAYGVAQSVVNLSVHGPPTLSVLPEGPVRVKVGKDITLECVSAGEPRASARWTRVGTPAKMEPRMFGQLDSHVVLKIASAKPSDAGTYMCLAQNALGTAQKQVEVIVDTGTVAPGAPQVQVNEAELTLEAGRTATLRCSATGNPTPTIHWSKLRSPLPWQHRLEGDTLVIPRVAQQDSGQYICNASSPAGHAEATVILHVESPPYATIVPERASVQAREPVQLQCLAHGTPPLSFQWSRMGSSLPSGATARNELLHLEPIGPEDSGTYRCQVTNKVGSAEAFAHVLVQGPSGSLPDSAGQAGSPPTVQVTPQLETKNIGANVEFHCAVPSNRGTQLRWFKEGGQLPPGHSVQDGVLRIQNLDQSCQGTYVCQAHGPWGQAQASAQLVVQALPSVLINTRTSVQTVVVGHSIEFECLALGDPKPQVTWSKVGGQLRPGIVQSGSVIRIAHVELSDAGQYRCTATNAAGTTQSHVLLLVQALPQISTPPEVRVLAGSAAVFPCMASGYPTPDITWSKLDGDLPPDSRLENNMLMLPAVRPEDAGTYVCTATNRQGKVKAFAYLQVPERVVPYFTQTPHSFLPLPTIKDAYKKFEIKIIFRPDSADGMLLYNGQKRTPGSPTNLAHRQPDFISFGLVGGRPEFRFDAGSGMATIRHPMPLALGQFHTVTLLRSLTQGSLIVGNLAPVNGTSQGKFQGLDLNEELYLGGYPDYNAIPKAGLSSGFVGCVRELRIQGEETVFHDLNLTAHGISHCPTCQDRPCQNGGQCHDSESSSYKCVCPAGFTGSRCEHSQALHCHPEACGPDATCVNRPDGRGYTCRCHLGHSGLRCEEGVTVTTPSMSGTGSYLALPALTNTHHELRLDVEFKPLAPDGILLFSGGKSGPVEDFVSLAMTGGHLEFRYELGSGLAVLRSPEPLALGRWHRVSAERLNKDGRLQVNRGRPVLRSSPGKSQGLNLHTLLYLGGVEPSVKLAPAANVSAHFRGCIGEVSVNGKRLDLTYSFLGSQGVGQCYDSSPCERQPCRNGATCMPAGEYEFQCLCQDGFKGDLCEDEENPCQLREPCLHGGTCQGTQCLCLPGFSGPRCQQGSGPAAREADWHLEGSGGNDAPGQYGAYFHDGGFLSLHGGVFSRSLPEAPETIELELRTSSANGLLLWQGVEVAEPGHSKDFISLGLKDGHLVFSYELGSGEAHLVSEDPINDGEWHRVTALRKGRRGSIQVDGEELVSGQSPGTNVAVNTKDSIYIGGAPDVAKLTAGRFSSGITGCIKNLVLHLARPAAPPPQPLDLQHLAQAGANTRPCPS